jgi:hypothetical protein
MRGMVLSYFFLPSFSPLSLTFPLLLSPSPLSPLFSPSSLYPSSLIFLLISNIKLLFTIIVQRDITCTEKSEEEIMTVCYDLYMYM